MLLQQSIDGLVPRAPLQLHQHGHARRAYPLSRAHCILALTVGTRIGLFDRDI